MTSQAAGYISGYRVPYSALDDIIDKNGDLWKALNSHKAENIFEETEKLAYDDFIIRDYNVRPGEYARTILKILGQDDAQEQTADGTSYNYRVFVVVIAGDQVTEIHTNNKQVQTRRWAHVGQPVVMERRPFLVKMATSTTITLMAPVARNVCVSGMFRCIL